MSGVDLFGRCLRCGRRVECSAGCLECAATSDNLPPTVYRIEKWEPLSGSVDVPRTGGNEPPA